MTSAIKSIQDTKVDSAPTLPPSDAKGITTAETKTINALAPATIPTVPSANSNETPKPLSKYPHTLKWLTTGVKAAKAGVYGKPIQQVITSASKPQDLKINMLMRIIIGCWVKSVFKKPDELKKEAEKDSPEIFHKVPPIGNEGVNLVHSLLFPLCIIPDSAIDSFITDDALPNRRITSFERDHFYGLQELNTKVSRVIDDTLKNEILDAAFHSRSQEGVPANGTTSTQSSVIPAAQKTEATAKKTMGFSLVDEEETKRSRMEAEGKSSVKRDDKEYRSSTDVKVPFDKSLFTSKGSSSAQTDVNFDMNLLKTRGASSANGNKDEKSPPMHTRASNTLDIDGALMGLTQLIDSNRLDDVSSWIEGLQVRKMSPNKKHPIFEKWIKALIAQNNLGQAQKLIDADISDPFMKGTLLSLIELQMKTLKQSMPKLISDTRTVLIEAYKAAMSILDTAKREQALKQIEGLKTQYLDKIQKEIAKQAEEKEKASNAASNKITLPAFPTSNIATSAAPPQNAATTAATPVPQAISVTTTPQVLSLKQHYDVSIGYKPQQTQEHEMAHVNKLKLKLIERRLDKQGKVAGKAIDNGDCFYHVFAQVLNPILKKQGKELVTVIKLRSQVSQALKEPKTAEWVAKVCENANVAPQGYEKYAKEVHLAHNSGIIPQWGNPTRDGKILSEIYKVNMDVILADIGGIEKKPAKKLLTGKVGELNKFLDTSEKCTFGKDPNESLTVANATNTVTMVVYQGHYLPVFDKAEVAPEK